MARKPSRSPRTAVLAGGALAVALAACGGDDDDPVPEDVPRGAIAIVGETPIPEERYDRFLTSRTRGISPLTGAASGGIPLDPPAFRRCIAAVRRVNEQGAQSDQRAPRPSAEELKQNCQSQYQQAQSGTVTQLVQYEWSVQEAADEDVEVSQEEVDRSYQQYVAAAGLGRSGRPAPPEQAERRFAERLKRSGLTEEDLKLELRAQLLQQKLLQERTKDVGDPSTEEARKFHEDNPEQFAGEGEKRPPFERVEDEAKQKLKSQRVQRAQIQMQNDLQRKWRPLTLCARSHVVPQCSNGPEPAELPLPR